VEKRKGRTSDPTSTNDGSPRPAHGCRNLRAAAVLAAAAPVGARTSTQSSATGTVDTRAWCAAVIRVNTKDGTMRNKRFLSAAQVPLSAWKKVVDAAVANRSRYLAIAPSEIKTAVKHQLAWFARVKANKYAPNTPLAPLTIADIRLITNFERTRCGISFGA
jgi:hypothetical protein